MKYTPDLTGDLPPFCNTGVPSSVPPSPTSHPPYLLSNNNVVNNLKFDWYQASVRCHIDALTTAFVAEFEGTFEATNGMHSYTSGLRHSGLNVFILWGGINPLPHIQISGSDADLVAPWLRSNFPDHTVSRADICCDFSIEKGFDLISGLIEPIARKSKASVTLIGDPDPSQQKGRTFYYGSRKSSDAFIRLYEKGFEQMGKGKKDVDPNWIRLECVFKPRKVRKQMASKWSPMEFFQMSKFITEATNTVLNLDGSFSPDPSLRRNNDDLAFEHMLSQYGRLLRKRVESKGWQALIRDIYLTIYTSKERDKMEKDDPYKPWFYKQKKHRQL